MDLSIMVSGLTKLFGDDLAALVDAMRAADAAGIDQIVMPDHVVMGPRLDRYPYQEKFPYPPSEPWLEPLTTLAAIAGATERIRLGTGVLIAPLRPVLVLAKTVATLDVLSRGRVELGVGTGWQREEYAEPGMGFIGRTQRMDDAMRACRALWETDGPVTFRSETISFDDIWCAPRPVQPRVPVWFGGAANDATIRRVAELGDGWLPLGPTLDEIASTVEKIRHAMEERGRDPMSLRVRHNLATVHRDDKSVDVDATVAQVAPLADYGITTVALTLSRCARRGEEVRPFFEALGTAWQANR
jgi:probable F420-dependent oxidoreductase